MDKFIKKWRMENAPIPPPNIDIDDIEVNVPIDIQPPNLDLDVHVVPNPNIDVLIDLQPIENPFILDDDDVNERGGSSSKRGYEENDGNVEVEQLLKRSHIEHASVEIGSSSRPSTPSPFVTFFVEDVDLANLAADPGLRRRILDYHPNKREEVRRAYLLKGPCQPKSENFPQIKIGNDMRSFNNDRYTGHEGWLEYSAEKNALFCLYCYLFRPDQKKQGGGSVWVKEGFRNFEQKVKLNKHVGKVKSLHNQAYMKCRDLLNQKQHLETLISRQSNEAQRDYRIHLTAVMKAVKFLLKQGLAFRGNDESPTSKNKGNYLELMDYTEEYNEELKMVRRKAPENLKLISSDIQKDMVNAAAVETTNAILADHGNALFSIMIDEARDVSIKEQMALVLRYVDKQGCVVERFVGVVHVLETNAMALKSAIDALFSKYNLNIMRLRGQGYDGASNMQGDLNGLKALILRENPYAFFIHCFAHQLQLALIAVAKKKAEVACVFNYVAMLVNVVGASCKRRDMLREKRATKVVAAFENGEISSGRGLNQETSLKRSGDTRWGSHYATLVNLILMFTSVLDVLVEVKENGLDAKQRGEANSLLDSILKFDFILGLHFMKNLLGISNDLSKALQKKDQEIVNAMSLVKVCKMRIQMMRDNGWDPLLAEVSLVCAKHNVFVPKMEDAYVAHRPKKGAEVFTNLHHYRDLFFYESIAWQSNELDNRFNEVNTELLLCMACLCPRDSFVAFNKEKLIRFAEFYPLDFTPMDLMVLSDQLETYVMDVRSSNEFLNLNGIGDLAKKMVETRKNIVFPLVYLLVTLALILPVATASVERAFSAMKIVKSRLRNRMGDELLNDYLVTYIEREFFDNIEDEAILQRFQNMKPRRGQLWSFFGN